MPTHMPAHVTYAHDRSIDLFCSGTCPTHPPPPRATQTRHHHEEWARPSRHARTHAYTCACFAAAAEAAASPSFFVSCTAACAAFPAASAAAFCAWVCVHVRGRAACARASVCACPLRHGCFCRRRIIGLRLLCRRSSSSLSIVLSLLGSGSHCSVSLRLLRCRRCRCHLGLLRLVHRDG